MNIEEMREHEWVVSWSGGKDSTATIILCHLHNIPIKKIVYVRMMWDEDTPATLPIMTEFVDKAKEVFESWGYPVEVVPSIKTAKQLVTAKYKRSKYPERNGNYYGVTAFCRGFCTFTGIKTQTIKKLALDDYEMIGYASDEVARLDRLGGKKQSIMYALGVTEKDAFKICEEHNLLSPLYDIGFYRDGCWFCPNAVVKQRQYLKDNNPELVEEVRKMIEMCNYDIGHMGKRNNWVAEWEKGEL